MLVINSFRGLSIVTFALAAPNVCRSDSAGIHIESAYLHSIEISYSFNAGDNEFCFLGLLSENDGTTPNPSVSHQFISDERIDEVSPLADYTQYALPAEEEQYFVYALPVGHTFSGSLVIYDEGGLPDGDEITMRLVVRGFECDAISFAERERGFSQNRINFRTSAPITVVDDKLLVLDSDIFDVDFRRR